MSPRVGRHHKTRLSFILLVLPALAGCTSIGDFGRLDRPFVTDNIHDWVGQEAAGRAGALISFDNLTEDERTLRDLAFPLIVPPYGRQRWDAILYEYGVKREFRNSLWIVDPTAYYRALQGADYRSTAGRYNRLIDDIRNDAVRIPPFFDIARRVVELDRRRRESLDYLPDISPPDRLSALARIGENTLTIVWVQHSLAQRCAGYRFALDHLVVAEPENVAAQADIALALLQQQLAANELVPDPRFAALPRGAAAEPPPIVK